MRNDLNKPYWVLVHIKDRYLKAPYGQRSTVCMYNSEAVAERCGGKDFYPLRVEFMLDSESAPADDISLEEALARRSPEGGGT